MRGGDTTVLPMRRGRVTRQVRRASAKARRASFRSPRARWARKGNRPSEAPEEAEFGVADGHGAFPYVAGPGMKLFGRGGRPSEAGADSGMGRSTIAGALLRSRPAVHARSRERWR